MLMVNQNREGKCLENTWIKTKSIKNQYPNLYQFEKTAFMQPINTSTWGNVLRLHIVITKNNRKKHSKHERFSEVLGKEIESCSTYAAFSLASHRKKERQQLEKTVTLLLMHV